MNMFQEMAHDVIEMVEGKIRSLHPVVDEYACNLLVDDERINTLLHGEGYYDLENEVTEYLQEIMDIIKR